MYEWMEGVMWGEDEGVDRDRLFWVLKFILVYVVFYFRRNMS